MEQEAEERVAWPWGWQAWVLESDRPGVHSKYRAVRGRGFRDGLPGSSPCAGLAANQLCYMLIVPAVPSKGEFYVKDTLSETAGF